MILLAGLFSALAAAPVTTAADRPNILFIFTDDQRWDTIHALGNSEVRTPNLDRLVREGFHFNNAYCMGSMVGAVCLPSRTMLITGRSLWRIPENPRAATAPSGVPLLPAVMNEAGYVTFHHGKAGNSCTFGNAAFTHNYPSQGHTRAAATEHADKTIEFLKQHDGSRPFFVYLAPPVPHDPRIAPEEYHKQYPSEQIALSKNFLPEHPWDNGDLRIRDELLAPHPRTPEVMRQHLADYYAVCTQIDHEVGRILATVRERGWDQNTYVIFSSDQGLAVGGRHGLMGKQNLYEHVKPPLIVHGPGIPHGKSSALVYLFDLFPTICDLAGAKVPAEVEGKSLLPVIRGSQPRVRETLFAAYKDSQRMIRDERWKLIEYHAGGQRHTQLFDLQTDPDEIRNLAAEPAQAAELARLRNDLASARKDFGDPVAFEADKGPADKVPEKKDKKKRAALVASRPNIVLIMPDDMGWGDIAAHGNSLIQTPNLDRLYRESVRLTDFHVSPTCSPTRSALMSGRHEFKNGVTHTINERERLALKTTTLAQVLKSAGYTTGIFGKWHLGDEDPYQPQQRGFDEVFIHGAGGIGQTYAGSCGDAPNNKYFDPAIRHNGTFVKTKGYCTDLFFAQALKWMNAKRQGNAPFFAYITPNAPHAPLVSPGPQYDQLYEGKEIGGTKLAAGDVAYYAMISNIDDNVGRVLASLQEWGVVNDTLVIFLSDNGGTHTRLYSGGFRGGKGTMYHGGTHAPSFWRWPGKLAAGSDSPALSAHLDVLPTLAEIAGAKLDDVLRQQVEGRSLVPLLANPQANWPDRTLITHVGRWEKGAAAQSKHNKSSIRNSHFRLVENRELYDLSFDPGETTNVIAKHPDEVAKLRAAYDQWWQEVQPLLVNEDAIGPKVNPFKAAYWKQFGGGPKDTPAEK